MKPETQQELFNLLYQLEDFFDYDETNFGKEIGLLLNKLQEELLSITPLENAIKDINVMTKQIELELEELGFIKVDKSTFKDYWDMLYDTLLTKYGISSSEADRELTLYYNQLN